MATRIETTLVCDRCDRDDAEDNPVESHELVVDGKTARADACGKCWSKALAGLAFMGGAVVESRKTGQIVCLDCNPRRRFETERGLLTHRRRAHGISRAADSAEAETG